MDETLHARLCDSNTVAGAIASWASAQFSTSVTVLRSGSFSGGLDNFVHWFALDGDGLPPEWRNELVVRGAPSPRTEGALNEAAVPRWVRGLGFPAGHVVAVLTDDWEFALPAQIATRVPGVQLLGALKRRPLQVRTFIRDFAKLHAQLHQLDTTTWPVPANIADGATWRMRDIDLRAAHNAFIALHARNVRDNIAWCRTHGIEAVVCHGDFHPLNIVYDESTRMSVVIDWTDATLDDQHCDIARTATLLRCAAIAGSSGIERLALRLIGPALARAYLREYRRACSVDIARLRRWETLHLLSEIYCKR